MQLARSACRAGSLLHDFLFCFQSQTLDVLNFASRPRSVLWEGVSCLRQVPEVASALSCCDHEPFFRCCPAPTSNANGVGRGYATVISVGPGKSHSLELVASQARPSQLNPYQAVFHTRFYQSIPTAESHSPITAGYSHHTPELHIPTKVHLQDLHVLATDAVHHPHTFAQLSSLKEQLLLRLNSAATEIQTTLECLKDGHPHMPWDQMQLAAQVFSARLGSELQRLGRLSHFQPGTDQRFVTHVRTLRHLRATLDAALLDFCAPWEKAATNKAYWQDPPAYSACSHILDTAHSFTICARLLLAQHQAAMHTLLNGGTAGGTADGTAGGTAGSTTGSAFGSTAGGASSMDVVRVKDSNQEAGHQPGEEQAGPGPPSMVIEVRGGVRHVRGDYMEPLPAGRKPPAGRDHHHSLVDGRANLLQLLRGVAQDCRAFCIEKNSACPDLNVSGDPKAVAVVVVPYVEYVVTEVLKNALQAVIGRYGAWHADEADPVLVEVNPLGEDKFAVEVMDSGGGIPPDRLPFIQHYYYSHTRVPKRMGYGYSRDHGSTFHGLGVGVPLARLYTKIMGGELTWKCDHEKGSTRVTLVLPTTGFAL